MSPDPAVASGKNTVPQTEKVPGGRVAVKMIKK